MFTMFTKGLPGLHKFTKGLHRITKGLQKVYKRFT